MPTYASQSDRTRAKIAQQTICCCDKSQVESYKLQIESLMKRVEDLEKGRNTNVNNDECVLSMSSILSEYDNTVSTQPVSIQNGDSPHYPITHRGVLLYDNFSSQVIMNMHYVHDELNEPKIICDWKWLQDDAKHTQTMNIKTDKIGQIDEFIFYKITSHVEIPPSPNVTGWSWISINDKKGYGSIIYDTKYNKLYYKASGFTSGGICENLNF